jgi:hypothetical protein
MRRLGGLVLLSACLVTGCGDSKTDRLAAGRDAILVSDDHDDIARRIEDSFESFPQGTKVRVVKDRSKGSVWGEVDVLILEGKLKDKPASFLRQNIQPVG